MKKKISLLLAIVLLFPTIAYAKDNYSIEKLETNITINEKEITYKDKISTTLQDNSVSLEKDVNKLYYNGDKKAVTMNLKNDGGIQNNTIEYTIPLEKKHNDIALSNDYNTSIKELVFEVTLDVKYHEIRFLLNGKDITDDSSLTYSVQDNVIKGKYTKTLEENDDLVISLKNDEKVEKTLSYIDLIVPIICLIISYIIWYKYGKDLKNPNVKKIQLPDKNPLEVSFMYNNYNKKEDYIYMLIYLANKGALKIKESKEQYIIIRNDKYETNNKQEQAVLDKIFTNTQDISLTEFITKLEEKNNIKNDIKELDIKDYVKKIKYLEKTNDRVTKELNLKEKYFEKTDSQRNIIVFLMTLTLVTITSIPFINIHKTQFILIPAIFSILILYTMINILGKNRINIISARRAGILFSTIVIAWLIIITSMSSFETIHIISFIIGIIATIIMTIIYKYMPKRTKYGTKELAKIEAIKSSMKNIDTMDIEEELKQNKNYIYDLLPYLYITGSQDNLIKKSIKLKIKSPSWFQSTEERNIEDIDKLINKMIKMINSK